MSFKFIAATIIIPTIFVLDQITKKWAVAKLKGNPPIEVIKGFFDFRYVENPGAAWGILGNLDSSIRKPFFIIVSIIAIVFIIYFFIKIKKEQRTLSLAMSLILGGAFGNFYDRVVNSYVVDFIHWYYKDYHWPTFNIADSSITCGVFLMIIHMIFFEKKESEAKVDEKSSTIWVEPATQTGDNSIVNKEEKKAE
ncbi:MAG: signal peptidase II [Deltaproteobacteria bacterium]|nr:signal peptidase II [Deltaproteobacteria bacterium]